MPRASSSARRNWRASDGSRPGSPTRSGTRWGRSGPTWRGCAAAGPKRARDAGRTAFRRGYERRPARVEFAAGQAGALLLVADSGPGVAAEDRDKIFEPFYTTKEPGRGTGLGLAIVARAVHDMGGVVWVDPAREGGAAFKMFFPAVPHVPPLRNAERGSGGEV